ncbi:MAG TPA: alpha/beta hydrolase [Ktedonobacteraceae bacterium]|jgi:pimeloyl-ACP methyl ester carboxylesterase|nr:alpha/beta hydrolase [Ktedonobacteraceae bacterium]
MNHPIVFIHGSGDSARIWRPQIDYFGTERAFAIDLPGHGKRPDSLPEEVSVMDYARAAHNTIFDELQLDHPVVAGHSLGGAIALAMGLEYGSELGGLILIGTGARLRVHPDLLKGARETPQQTNLQMQRLALATTTDPAILNGPADEQAKTEPNMLYRDLTACNIFDVMARLDEIHLPTLIICGTEDRLTPVKYSDYLHNHIAGSTLITIPQAGHYVFREQPEAVNKAIEEWMRES